MKKLVKILLWIFVIIFGGAILLFLSSPLWLGPLAKSLATSLAPKYTGTDFKVAKIYVNPYTGCLRVEDFHLGNPEGYDAEDAVSVGKFNVDIAIGALFGNKLHIKNVDIIDPYASYLGNNGTNNFDAILANLKSNFPPKEEEEEEKDDKKKMKVVIDRFHIEGVKFKMGIMPTIPIPIPITLHDLGTKDSEGKETDGISMKEMGSTLASQVSGAFSKAGGSFMSIFGGDAAKGVGDAVKGLGDGVSNAASAATDALKNLGSSATDALKNIGGGDAAKSAGEGASKAADAATDALKNLGSSATDALKNIGGGGDAAKSAGEGASKATGAATDAAKSVGEGAANAASKATDVATDAAKSVGEGAKNLLKGAGGLFGGSKDNKK